MYDPNSRLILTHRIMDERLAETRRAHLLRTDRDEVASYAAHDRLGAAQSWLGRMVAALHRSTRPATTHRPAFR